MHHISHRKEAKVSDDVPLLEFWGGIELDLNWNQFVCPISGFQFVFLKKKHYRRLHKKDAVVRISWDVDLYHIDSCKFCTWILNRDIKSQCKCYQYRAFGTIWHLHKASVQTHNWISCLGNFRFYSLQHLQTQCVEQDSVGLFFPYSCATCKGSVFERIMFVSIYQKSVSYCAGIALHQKGSPGTLFYWMLSNL